MDCPKAVVFSNLVSFKYSKQLRYCCQIPSPRTALDNLCSPDSKYSPGSHLCLPPSFTCKAGGTHFCHPAPWHNYQDLNLSGTSALTWISLLTRSTYLQLYCEAFPFTRKTLLLKIPDIQSMSTTHPIVPSVERQTWGLFGASWVLTPGHRPPVFRTRNLGPAGLRQEPLQTQESACQGPGLRGLVAASPQPTRTSGEEHPESRG